MNHGADTMLPDPEARMDDAGLNPALQPTPYPGQGSASYRRRPIVVRDPRTGDTRLVYGAGPGRVGGPPAAVGALPRSDYRGGMGDTGFERIEDEADSEGRAPVVKIVSGYRGKQIVVRDPARAPGGPMLQGDLGVRDGGVRKANYYERRSGRSPPYSPDGYDERGRSDARGGNGAYYDDDEVEDARLYGRGRDREYGRGMDQHMGSGHGYGDSRYDTRDYYRSSGGSGHDGVAAHDDLTGKVVYVDNLSDDVTTTGLADLFGMVGAVKELRLLYDRQGNPNGSADIVFQRRADAEEAIKSLHNVPLNNRPMRLSMGNGL